MKTDESVHGSGAHSGGTSNGVAGAASAAPVQGEARALPSLMNQVATPKQSRLLAWLYWIVWFGGAPIVLASLAIWALSPSSGAERSGTWGWIQSLVQSQPVPVGIVLFTVLEVVLWGFRHELPLAGHAHPPLRADVPPNLRGAFDRARLLVEEVETILSVHGDAVVRDLKAEEREAVRDELNALRDAMERSPFDPDLFNAALARAEGKADDGLGRWRKSQVREYAEAIIMAVAVAFGLRAVVIEAFKIPSGSMIPTLMVGDHIFVNKFIYGPAIPFTQARFWSAMPPKRGDVMVFAFPEHPEEDFIKRVVAIEGDKLEARMGHPILNGWEVPSCMVGPWSYDDYDSGLPLVRHAGDLYVEYLGSESFLTFYDRIAYSQPSQGPFYVKKGEVWVMGDNRNNSHDSRMWFNGRGGGVPYENIRGRALFVWLSVGEAGVDWSRFGLPVMGRPTLPASAKALQPAFEQCLKDRPAVTLPPPPSP